MMKRSTQDRIPQRAGGWCEQVYRSCGNGLRSSELNPFCHLYSGARIVSRQGGMFSRYPWTGYRQGICGLPAYIYPYPSSGPQQRPIKVAPRSISLVLLFCSRLGNRMKDEAFLIYVCTQNCCRLKGGDGRGRRLVASAIKDRKITTSKENEP
ncbi:hypothetical protein SAMN06272722_10534 [Paenibacillus sp. RU5A]|nr:hypothetical protein SAMN06272722_10534 [Paenibacillus sp. RU5A]SOC70790.1 hypothetical protein SAMN05880581_10533 [Paenibacillus sp. RU26A]SOC73148.1 hypothetical protein SAMN05880586_10534 [Paenibacillus sp. RU5M]